MQDMISTFVNSSQNIFYVEIFIQFYHKYIFWLLLLHQASSKYIYMHIADVLDILYE